MLLEVGVERVARSSGTRVWAWRSWSSRNLVLSLLLVRMVLALFGVRLFWKEEVGSCKMLSVLIFARFDGFYYQTLVLYLLVFYLLGDRTCIRVWIAID